VANGDMYIESDDEKVYAFDLAGGEGMNGRP
jgi:hypothetical protein